MWFAQAHRSGSALELGSSRCCEAAVARPSGCRRTRCWRSTPAPRRSRPSASRRALEAIGPERLIVELTEHVDVEDYPELHARAWRPCGTAAIRLAIDDAGAGFASLMHILKLGPDYIKLDRQLITGIDIDPVRQCLAGSLMRFAYETGATIAEGVETAAELHALHELGIRYVQGFYLARPVGVAELPAAARAGRARARRNGELPSVERGQRRAWLHRSSSRSTTTGAWSEGFVPLRASRSM